MNLVACFRTRFEGRTDRGWEHPDPSIDELVALSDGDDVLGGGEPTLRSDLPALVEALPQARLHTDGLAFAEGLRGLPLSRVRIDLHSGRQDAHDWLVGRAGAAKAAVRAIRRCLEAGLDVEVETLLTRPTLPHVGETLALVERLGVRAVRLRRIERRGPAAADFIALSPRLLQMREVLEGAWREGMDIKLLNTPHPEDDRLLSEQWSAPGEHPLAAPFEGYEGLFGERELAAHFGRGLVGERHGEARVDLSTGTSRELRRELVRVAEVALDVHIDLDLDRPEAPGLLHDALRLFRQVRADTTGSGAHWSAADRRHLKRLRID